MAAVWLVALSIGATAAASIGFDSAQAMSAGGAAHDGGGRTTSSTPVISPNWSGYVVTGSPGTRYSSVTGTWREPAVSCVGGAGSFSTIAVGLGGYGSDAQSDEQVGTDANCRQSGVPEYYGWFDIAPYPSYRLPRKVSPGDILTATVSIVATERPPLVKIRLDDATQGWSTVKEVSWVSAGQFLVQPGEQNTGGLSSPAATSAEWLVEAPTTCEHQTCSPTSLADFGAVAMTRISAVADGSAGTLADPRWKAVRLRLVPGRLRVPSYPSSTPFARNPATQGTAKSPAGATPGRATNRGRAFKVKWSVGKNSNV